MEPTREPTTAAAAAAAPVDLHRLASVFVDPAQDRRIKRGYLRHFAGCRTVLDVGCGTGTFLEVLAAAGLQGTGIDASAAAATTAAAHGHEVRCGDAIAELGHLAAQQRRFDGALLAHLIEHFEPARAIALLAAVARVLPSGGTLVVVTPNCTNHIVLEQVFWLDPTHVRPYPPALLQELGNAAGFTVIEGYIDPASAPRRSWPRRALALLRWLLSGTDRCSGMDAVVVLRRR